MPSLIPYNATLRPTTNTRHEHRGTVDSGHHCPVCHHQPLYARTIELPDGSLVGNCPECRSPLRMNQHGFLFFDTETR